MYQHKRNLNDLHFCKKSFFDTDESHIFEQSYNLQDEPSYDEFPSKRKKNAHAVCMIRLLYLNMGENKQNCYIVHPRT